VPMWPGQQISVPSRSSAASQPQRPNPSNQYLFV
jgi:hypothetical protein